MNLQPGSGKPGGPSSVLRLDDGPHRDERTGAWPQVELEMPSLPAPVFIDGQTLARSWTFPSEDFFDTDFSCRQLTRFDGSRRLF